MKITVERGAFLKALSHVQSVVERRNTIPILSNVMIEAAKGRLKLTATDLDIEIVEMAWRWASARADRRRSIAPRRRWPCLKGATMSSRTTSNAWPDLFSPIAWWSTRARRWRSAAPTWATASSKRFSV